MANNVFSISCPTSCGAATDRPALPEDMCQTTLKQSEIYLLLIQGTAAGPTDASSGSAWTTPSALIDNTDTTGAKFHYLIGRGSLGTAAETIQTGARNAESVTSREFTLTFTVFDIADPLVYDYCRDLQCGSKKPRIMYASEGGWLYCKVGASTAADNGIQTKSVTVSFPKDEGKEAVDRAVITMKWDALTDPDRVVNPLTLG